MPMFTGLVRWFGRGAGSERSGRGGVSARLFTPRLEGMEDRAVPSGVVSLLNDGPPTGSGGNNGLLALKATPILFSHSTGGDVTPLVDGPPGGSNTGNGLLGAGGDVT